MNLYLPMQDEKRRDPEAIDPRPASAHRRCETLASVPSANIDPAAIVAFSCSRLCIGSITDAGYGGATVCGRHPVAPSASLAEPFTIHCEKLWL